MDGHWVHVAANDYVIPASEDQQYCIFFIMPANTAMNILGMPLFVDYYTIHDPIAGTVGFAPHTTSLKKDLLPGTPSTTQFLQVGQMSQDMN